MGYNQIYKSTNSGVTWSSISQNFGANLDHHKIAPSDNTVMYASRAGLLYKTDTGGGTWQQLSGFTGVINSIAVHPSNPNKVALATTTAAKVFISDDGGQTWTSNNQGLPNFQALAVVWDDNGQDGLYLGMNYGIYYIDNTFTDWQPFNNNLPNVIINELEINTVEQKIYAATYGRGLWTSPLFDVVLSQNKFSIFEDLKVFPIPTEDILNVSWNKDYLSDLRLYDNAGKLVMFKRNLSLLNIYQFSVKDLTSGIYFLKINNEKGSVTKKISIK